MADRHDIGRSRTSPGCILTGGSAAVLALLSPFVLAVRAWRTWRRGSELQTRTEVGTLTNSAGVEHRRFDLDFDVPTAAEPGFRARLTDTIVRVAETLRAPDDVYHLVYRLPWDEEPVLLPIGPQLQELGERFSLVQSQGAMAGRTAVWLTLGREHALSEIVDSVSYDPEAVGEPESLLTHADLRWSMATEWARVGPSLVVRMIVIVPARHEQRMSEVLDTLL
jgi:hypothetical protein